MEVRLTFVLVALIWQVSCNRFAREELGVSDRLRFTSGKNQYYECEIVDNKLVSNLKIGIYVYNLKSYIRYEINDTNFEVSTKKVEDFYFAELILKNKNISQHIHRFINLIARDSANVVIDNTLLRVAKTRAKITSAPKFINSSFTQITLYDDEIVGSSVGKLFVENQETPIAFYLGRKELENLKEFTVSMDGRIILVKRLDASKQRDYIFPVYARYIESSKSSSINVTVKVNPAIKSTINPFATLRNLFASHVDRKVPYKSSVSKHKTLTFSFSELSPVYTIIGSVKDEDENFLYTIITGNENGIFTINSKTGVISLQDSKKVDYETRTSYRLSITGKNSGSSLTADVKLNVIDENDNSPAFTKKEYNFEVDEGAQVGHIITTFTANDRDSGTNGEISFSLSNDNDLPFSLQHNGTLKVTKSLDLLHNSVVYVFYPKAVDWGSPIRRESEVLVRVRIKAKNTYIPVLKQSHCNIDLPETSQPAELMTLEAVDGDIIDKLTFQLDSPNDYFSVDKSTGMLTKNQKIMSAGKSVALKISVNDSIHKSDVIEIRISLKGEKLSVKCEENKDFFNYKELIEARSTAGTIEKPVPPDPPITELRFMKTPEPLVSVSEGSKVNTIVGVFNALNPNLKSYGLTLYTISSGNDESKFQIDLFNGTLFLRDKLDRETTSFYKLTVKASGNLDEPPAVFIFSVRVNDINDNAPVFENNGFYKVSISENKNIGYVLVKVKANDADLDLRSRSLKYSLTSPSSIFKMNADTGDLTLISLLSKQPFKEYFLEVQASDKSQSNQLHGYAKVHITIAEFKNTPPICLSDEQRIEVPTNTPAGVIIGRVFAYDINEGKAGKLTFVIKKKDKTYFDDYFSLNKRTGLIRLKKQLSQQDKGIVFEIEVEVRDNAAVPLKAICHVYKIIVDGFGISRPRFIHSGLLCEGSVNPDAGPGAYVTQLKAVLQGNETSQNIKYDLVDGNGVGIFTIDKLLGTIYVSDNQYTDSFYWLTVQAYLESNPSSYRNAHVLIRIQYPKERHPFFNPSVYHVQLTETEETERSLVQLYATDGSRRYNVKGLKYSVHAGNKDNMFEIDNNAWLKSKKLLVSGKYRLNVTVSSPTNQSLLSYGYVVITVDRYSNNPPSFESNMISVIVYEASTDRFQPPYLFQASARNPSPTEKLNYKIESAQGLPLTINPDTGVISTKDSLSLGGYAFLSVQAQNSDGKSQTAMYTIKVTGRPEKKTTLLFKKKMYYADVSESTEIGSTIKDFIKEIEHSKNGHGVFFYILSGNDHQNFYFSPMTGQLQQGSLKLWAPLNFERQAVHKLNILAYDGWSYSHTTLTIRVDNINENSLAASQACFEARIPENKRGIDQFINVQVTNPGRKLPGFKYSMVNDAQGRSPFSVDNTGAISVKPNQQFDREVQDEYVITVVAGLSTENATYCVNVHIEDMNDHPPNFTQNVYKINIFDSVSVGSFIMTALATDKDTGSNARLSYSFEQENKYFGINAQTGIVFVKDDLSSISNHTVVLDTVATDHGKLPLSSRARIEVNVIKDLKRHNFLQPLYAFNISENLPGLTLVSDAVKLNVSSAHYLVRPTEKNDCHKKFWVDPFTGIILTSTILDSEEYRQCRFKIEAVIFNKVVTTADIFIMIVDVNDNMPIFKKTEYSGSVAEGQNSNTKVMAKGNEVLVVKATDEDAGENGDIVYSFVEETVGIYFKIDEKSGEITTNKVLNCEKHQLTFNFHVQATDRGKPGSMSSRVPVTINVLNVNDCSPHFVDMQVITLTVPAYKGMPVHQLKAKDEDIIPQNLTFKLDDQKGVFGIHPKTGEIFVFDPSLLRNQRLLAQATVSDSKFDSMEMIQIKLIHYAPDRVFRFPEKMLVASVTENENIQGAIAVANPMGYKIGEQLRFRILNPIPEFVIGESTGVVTVPENLKFDREKKPYYFVHIEAWRTSSPFITARTVLNVTVEDQNDNAPEFEQKIFYKAIDIDNAIGSSLLSITANDADVGKNAEIEYSITGGDGTEFFNCHAHTGLITLKKKFIKSLAKKKYTLEIKASDLGKGKRYNTATVEMHLNNRDQPMFTRNYIGTVSESAPKGYSVAHVNAIGRNNRQVYYQIIEGDEFEVFHVGFTNGELSVAGKLDWLQKNHYNMKIRAIDSLTGSWSDAICDITVVDVNNNFPIFEKPFYLTKVTESKNIGNIILTVLAQDLDVGRNSEIVYTLSFLGEESKKLFSIDPTSGQITLTGQLDAETEKTHMLKVIATDAGNPPKSSYTYVQIGVLDTNDNKPRFLETSYHFSFESYQQHMFLGQVQAFDADASDVLSFSIRPRSKYVMIDAASGILRLITDPNRIDTFKLKALVSDGRNQAEVDVTIQWTRRNEHKPKLLSNYTSTVKENGENKVKVIATLLAEDQDKGRFGEIHYQFDTNDYDNYFSINTKTGVIRTKPVAFDYEVTKKFVLPVRATDGGGLFSRSVVVVNVEDENDNIPTFEFSKYKATVKTTQMFDDSLINASAVDHDGGINGDLKYVAHGLGSSPPLIVSNKTGMISLAGAPRGNKYQFSILVSDNGYPVQQSRSEIEVLVKKWNENIFTFTNQTYVHYVREDVEPSIFLLSVSSSYEGEVTFQFEEGNLPYTRPKGVFDIDTKEGKINLITKLDYEVIPFYKLMVNARTANGEEANCYVIIHVINVNDNSPKFHTRSYSLRIAEDTSKGTEIIQVSASDLDDPEGINLSYSFSSKSTYFAIDKHTGLIRIKNALDREQHDTHKLIIRVKDKDGEHMDKVNMLITIIDVNDSPPNFKYSQYSFHVKENAIVRQIIGTVSAHDRDQNSTVQYFFESTKKNNRQFSLNHNTGALSILRPMKAGVIEFTVIAYDGLHVSTAGVKINVDNVDDHNPICLNSYYKIRLSEDYNATTPISTIRAKYEDLTADLKYVVQGDGMGKFTINERTGSLSATKPLDYEAQSQHNFKVIVSASSGHSCESDVFLQLKDVNDNVPMFDQKLYIATVYENTSQSVVVSQVRATDLDTRENRKISYSIKSGNIGKAFKIWDRGIVTVKNPAVINRKMISTYNLLIEAKDSGVPQLSSTTRLKIIVLSTTDTPPQFEKLGYVFNITENNEPDVEIGRIIVKSTKNLKSKKVIVTFINDVSKYFYIDGTSLKVKSKLDYESQSRYSFNIRAYYEKIPSLSSTVNVEVQVNDQNDHKPLFLQNVIREIIDENVRPGRFVSQTYAHDRDGSNKNSIVTYSLESDSYLPFVIGSQSGVITVNGSIDHEIRSSYVFTVVARDNGTPQHVSKVQAIVNVTDLNDNAPIINDYNVSVIVQEGREIDSEILRLSIHDIDSPKNGAPFDCILLDGDKSMFDVNPNRIDSDTCIVVNKQKFNRAETEQYNIKIRVTDSGTPTQFSDSAVKIVIVQQSFHMPSIQEPKIFFVIVSRPYGVTKIGQVKVFDKDVGDLHRFTIMSGNDQKFFFIQQMSGVIEGRPIEGSYSLTLQVTDGRFTDSGIFKIIVNEFNDAVKTNSIYLTLNGVDLKAFMQSKLVQFVLLLAQLSGTTNEKVFIWSIQESNSVEKRKRRDAPNKITNSVSLAVAVRKKDSFEYINPSMLKGYVENSKSKFTALGIEVSVAGTECVSKKCPDKQKCIVTLSPTEEIVSLYVPSGYMKFKSEEKCYCADGTEGPVCYETNPCSNNPCKIGQRCVVTRTYFKCECIDPKNCDLAVDTVTLTGDSYIQYQLKKPFNELFESLSIRFRTETTSNDVIFSASGDDYFFLEIENGFIMARFDFGSGKGVLKIDRRRVNDGNWHDVVIERSGNFVWMMLDDKKSLRVDGKAIGNSAKINIEGNGIIFGASRLSSDGQPLQGFKGCFGELKLRNKVLPFSGSNEMVASVEEHNVQPNCKDSGVCSTNKCPRFSRCIDTLSSYKCQCLKGHYGSECKTKMTCKDKPCQNGGRCTYEEVDGTVFYKCTCRQGFTGEQCQTHLGKCASKPCENNGTCILINENKPFCKCMVGFTGPRCKVNENPCASNPCKNRGKCVNLFNDYHCDCPDGKFGKQCSAGEYCLYNPCKNGGTCVELLDGFRCLCEKTFHGDRCEKDRDECLETGTCLNDVCINTIGDYHCNCTTGRKSKSCADPVEKEKEKIPKTFLIVGAIGALILISAAILALVCFWKRHHRNYDQSRHGEIEPRPKYPLDRYAREDEYDTFLPPSPPPRGGILPPDYYEDNDQASAAMYDPSMVTFSSSSSPDECLKVPLKFSPPLTSLEYNSEEEEDMKSQAGGYHWDYSEVPEDIIIKKMSREGSRIQLTKTDNHYYEHSDDLQYVDMPEVPERPASRRSSIPYPESELEIPELPELPQQFRSRLSLRSSNHSPSSAPRGMNPITNSEFRNRYSLLSDENDQLDAAYLHDDIEAETMSELTSVTRPPGRNYMSGGARGRYESESSNDDDGYTETSFNSDGRPKTNGCGDNPRDLERHIQKLFKDIQKRTEEDFADDVR